MNQYRSDDDVITAVDDICDQQDEQSYLNVYMQRNNAVNN